jgi:pilus assembly protein CpaB
VNRKRNLLSSLGLALVGTMLLVTYVRAAEGRASADQRMVPVVVVTTGVERGTTAHELRGALRVEQVPAGSRAPHALQSIDDLDGRVPSADLFPGEQLVSERLTTPDEVGADLPPGTTAVSISLEPQRAVAGQVRAGARVNVLASYDDPASTETVLHDALVQGVTRTDAPTDGGQTVKGTVLVTLAVSPADAERFVQAADHGRVWLAGISNLALSTEPIK